MPYNNRDPPRRPRIGSIKMIDTVYYLRPAKRAHQCLDLTNVLLLAPVRVLAMESNVLPYPVLVTQLPLTPACASAPSTAPATATTTATTTLIRA